MNRYSRYPAYKPSGIEWLGEIPAHWETGRLKNVALINAKTLTESTEPDYELEYVDIGNVTIHGLQEAPQKMLFENSPSRARRIVQADNTIISTVRTYLQAVAYFDDVPENLIASTGFAVLTPQEGIFPKFLYNLVRSPAFINAVTASSVGVSYPAINSSVLSCLPVWLPTIEEQRAIVAFLDEQTAVLDNLISEKQALIGLLQEKRAAVISRAVTQGLNSAVALKDSGVDWIGRIPVHWEIRRLKFVSCINPPKSQFTNLSEKTEVSFLPMEKIGADGSLNLNETRPLEQVKTGYTYFEENDVIMYWS